jgi:diguanylate cyclase (GGDEF)-like protein
MDLYPLPPRLRTLEDALAQAAPATLPALSLELAWGLRQRDSRRALALLQSLHSAAAPQAGGMAARASLIEAEILALRGEFDAAEIALAAARAGFAAADDPLGLGDTALTEMQLALPKGQLARCAQAQELAADCYAQAGDATRQQLAQAWITLRLAYGDLAAAQQRLDQAPPAADAHPALKALHLSAQGVVAHAREPARAALHLEQACLLAEEAGLLAHAISSAGNAGAALDSLGELDLAAQWYDWAAHRARAGGWPSAIGISLTRLGSLQRMLGQLAQSRSVLEEALAVYAGTPAGPNKAAAHYYLGLTLAAQGEPQAAAAALAEAAALFRQVKTLPNLAGALMLQARSLAEAGAADAARDALAEAQALCEQAELFKAGVDLHETRAELHRRGLLPGGAAAERAELEAALALGQRVEGWQPSLPLLRALSQACEADGDTAQALARARQALQAQEREALKKAADRAALLQARHARERDQAELEHQRERLAQLDRHARELALLGEIGRALTASLARDGIAALLAQRLPELLPGLTRVRLCTEPPADERTALPLRSGLRHHGWLSLSPPPPVSPLLEGLLAYLAVALDNAHAHAELEQARRALEAQSLTDPLTGLHNRRYLQQQIGADIAASLRHHEARSRRPEAPLDEADLIFLLVDVDHFKRVNDQHGHAAGDTVLVQMRERLRAVLRETDHLVRWGGEEFLVVARATTRERAAGLAERLRASVAAHPFVLPEGQALACSCSVGYACFPWQPAQPRALDWAAVVERADQALYAAKRNGRNAWVGLAPQGAALQVSSNLAAVALD